MASPISQRTGLEAYTSQLNLLRDSSAIVQNGKRGEDDQAGFRFKLGKLQISLLQDNGPAKDAMQSAMASMRGMEAKAWQAEMDVAALKQEIASPQRQLPAESSLVAARPSSRQRLQAAAAYAASENSPQFTAARPGTLIGVY